MLREDAAATAFRVLSSVRSTVSTVSWDDPGGKIRLAQKDPWPGRGGGRATSGSTAED